MVRKILLPTGEIVSKFQDFERLFIFYNEGIKGVVRDMVLVNDCEYATQRPRYTHPSHSLERNALVEKILHDYASSSEAVTQHYSENTTSETYVEIVSVMIAKAVAEMMSALFLETVYEVCKQRWLLIGNDLLVEVDRWN